jgi:predicted metal-dependent phosphoesterase TrpH
VKADLHAHTRYSRDSLLEPAELIACARRAGLDRIAVTDHNVIAGALEASSIDPSMVIVGEEISCAGGTHLIGLFLHEVIPRGLSVRHTAARIREQGGVVYAPHPFAYLRSASRHAREAIAESDVVEAFNARAFLPRWNQRALRLAAASGVPIAAGSDSHFAFEIGSAWTELPAFATADEFRASLSAARPVARTLQSPFVHCVSLGIQLAKAVRGNRHERRGALPLLPSSPSAIPRSQNSH